MCDPQALEPYPRQAATQIGSTLFSDRGLVKTMPRTNARITLAGGIVDVLTPGVRVEVRDYDIQGIGEHKQLWTDEQGKKCFRYFVSTNKDIGEADPIVDNFQRFAEDLQYHAGVPVTFKPDSSPDGLHVLQINKVDFYFEVGSGKYDGWGKAIEPDPRTDSS